MMIRRDTVAMGGLMAALVACGGGGSPSAPVVVATPTPVPVVVATPTPAPTPEPTAGEPPALDTKPVRLTLRLFVVETPSGQVYEYQTASDGTPLIPVNYKFRLDITAKDKKNKHTAGSGKPIWHFGDMNIVEVENFNNLFHPRLRATKAGEFTTVAELDGVFSNEVTVRLHW